jgi:hypothetical protein
VETKYDAMKRDWCSKEVVVPLRGGAVVTLGRGAGSFLDLSNMKREMGERSIFGMAYCAGILHLKFGFFFDFI